MTDMLLSLVAAVLVAAVGLVGLLALTLAPFVATVSLAERQGYGTVRWGVLAGAAVLVGLLGLAVVFKAGLPLSVAALAAAATWAAPLALVLLGGSGGRPAGVRGRHQ